MNKTISKNTLFEKYGKNPEHAQEVCKYSVMLFDALKENIQEFENINEQSKKYLEIAAYLHDIGYSVDKKSHHKHTMDIILKEGIEGFSEEEIKITANIARYHRNAFPNPEKHVNFAGLSAENQRLVTILGGIVRLADGLDKPHKNLILRISADENSKEINFNLKTIGFKPNLKMAENKKDLLEFALQKKINFVFV